MEGGITTDWVSPVRLINEICESLARIRGQIDELEKLIDSGAISQALPIRIHISRLRETETKLLVSLEIINYDPIYRNAENGDLRTVYQEET